MDKDRLDGAAKTVAGTLRVLAGTVIGDQKTVADGEAQKVAGRLQNAVGGGKDAIREALRTK
jgi:uncharacterized protein YjbJ (UPF0337 family)